MPIKPKVLPLILVLVAWALPPVARAGVPEYEVNIREGCRQAISGAYLKAYDDAVRLEDYAKSLVDEEKVLQQAVTKAHADAKKAATALATQTFDSELASQNDAAIGVAHSLDGQLADYAALRKKNATDLVAAKAEEKRLRALLPAVFVIERTQDRPDGGYPIHITYRSPCPKYRALCALPYEEREALKRITVGGRSPEPCMRYVSQSMIP